MKKSEILIIALVTLIIFITFVLAMQIMETEKYAKENKALKEAQVLEYDKGYQDAMYEYFDDYFRLMMDYVELEGDYRVLEERIKSLEKQDNRINIEDIMWDLDDLMEWTIRYYEVESQTLRDEMELWEYILWKDSELYERILNWWQ